MRCPCEDDHGVICNKIMTRQEREQDGMCSTCADKVWAYLIRETDTVEHDNA